MNYSYYYKERYASHIKKYAALALEIRQKLEKSNPRKDTTQVQDISYSSSLSSIIKEAKEFAKIHKTTLDQVRLAHSCYQQDYSDSYSSEAHLEVIGLETDDQYHARLMELYENTQAREVYERQEFERLKAKFK
jgi:hypothetical protein